MGEIDSDKLGRLIRRATPIPPEAVEIVRRVLERTYPVGVVAVARATFAGRDGVAVLTDDGSLDFVEYVGDGLEIASLDAFVRGALRRSTFRPRDVGFSSEPEETTTYTHPRGTLELADAANHSPFKTDAVAAIRDCLRALAAGAG